jgi:hypothetical protein
MSTNNTNESEREQRELRSIELQQILQPNSSHIATETAGEKAALLRCCKTKPPHQPKLKNKQENYHDCINRRIDAHL